MMSGVFRESLKGCFGLNFTLRELSYLASVFKNKTNTGAIQDPDGEIGFFIFLILFLIALCCIVLCCVVLYCTVR